MTLVKIIVSVRALAQCVSRRQPFWRLMWVYVVGFVDFDEPVFHLLLSQRVAYRSSSKRNLKDEVQGLYEEGDSMDFACMISIPNS